MMIYHNGVVESHSRPTHLVGRDLWLLLFYASGLRIAILDNASCKVRLYELNLMCVCLSFNILLLHDHRRQSSPVIVCGQCFLLLIVCFALLGVSYHFYFAYKLLMYVSCRDLLVRF